MSTWHKRALANAVVWGLVAVGFLICAFAGDGPAEFIKGAYRRNTAAIVLVVGILVSLVVRYLTRASMKSASTMIDERDRTIAHKSSEGAFAATAIFVFLLCILLHDRYLEAGSVPVGWVWFVAYSSWILAYLTQAVLSLLLYSGIGARAEG